MQSVPYIICLIIAYAIFWFKGNAKPVFNIELSPFKWWLYTSLITSYLSLHAWWHLVDKYKIWGAMAITYCLHTVIEISLNSYYYNPPTTQQALGLILLVAGAFLILR
jgi:hypothetical protein